MGSLSWSRNSKQTGSIGFKMEAGRMILIYRHRPRGDEWENVEQSMREIEDQLARGIYIPEKKVPTFDKVADDWLVYKRPNIRPSTWLVYEGYVKNKFSEFNQMQVNKITAAKVERLISGIQSHGTNISTIQRIITVLGQIMGYAVRHKYIVINPVRDAERPRGQGGEEKPHIQVWSPSEINAFIDAVKDKKYRTLFMLAIMSGARQGELLGLKWADVDWNNNQVHILRTYNKRAWYMPKTKTSDRKIDLGPAMIAELKKWKLACPPNELDLIFPNSTGGPIFNNNMLTRHFWPTLKASGVQRIRFHDLRHTYASLLIEQGENIKYIQN